MLEASEYAKQPFRRLALSRLLLVRATGCTLCQWGFGASFPMIFHTLACQGDQR
jgi:hypothetical protein